MRAFRAPVRVLCPRAVQCNACGQRRQCFEHALRVRSCVRDVCFLLVQTCIFTCHNSASDCRKMISLLPGMVRAKGLFRSNLPIEVLAVHDLVERSAQSAARMHDSGVAGGLDVAQPLAHAAASIVLSTGISCHVCLNVQIATDRDDGQQVIESARACTLCGMCFHSACYLAMSLPAEYAEEGDPKLYILHVSKRIARNRLKCVCTHPWVRLANDLVVGSISKQKTATKQTQLHNLFLKYHGP